MNERASMYTTVAVIAAIAGYAGAMIAIERTIPVLKTHRLEVVGEKNEVCGAFAAGDGTSTISLNNSTGKPGLVLGTVKDEPGIAMLDIAGRSRGGMMISDGVPGIWLADTDEKQRLQFGVRDDEPLIEILSSASQKVWSAP